MNITILKVGADNSMSGSGSRSRVDNYYSVSRTKFRSYLSSYSKSGTRSFYTAFGKSFSSSGKYSSSKAWSLSRHRSFLD